VVQVRQRHLADKQEGSMAKSMLEVVWRGGSHGARRVPALLGALALWTVCGSAAEHRGDHAEPVLRVDFEDCSEFASPSSLELGRSQLAELIGDTELGFVLLDSFNTFDDARLIVTKQ